MPLKFYFNLVYSSYEFAVVRSFLTNVKLKFLISFSNQSQNLKDRLRYVNYFNSYNEHLCLTYKTVSSKWDLNIVVTKCKTFTKLR